MKKCKFPDKLKIARVIPVYKSGSKIEPNNYRPISVLSVFSKIYEIILCEQLTQFFESNNILIKEQFGFRKGKSSELALMLCKDYILNNFKNKNIVADLFTDLKKAFDSINHNILVQKLTQYDLQNNALHLITDYLNTICCII